jgi:hypothetical protein
MPSFVMLSVVVPLDLHVFRPLGVLANLDEIALAHFIMTIWGEAAIFLQYR